MQTRIDDGFALPSREVFPPRILTGLGNSVAAVFALSFGCAVVAGYYGLFPSVIDWDESLYAVMAQHWLQGQLPYATVWDQHSVGLPALFAAILYFFPKSVVAIRLSACVAVAVAATALYFTARLIDRRIFPAAIAAFLYIAWTMRLWGLSANTEIYINALVASAMYAVVRLGDSEPFDRRCVAPLCLSALLLGIAVQVKHVVVAETILFFGLSYFANAWRSARQAWWAFAAAAACFLAPTIAAVAYFYSAGLIAAYFRAVVGVNLVYIVTRPNLIDVWPGFPKTFAFQVAIAIAAAIVLRWRQNRAAMVVLAWAIAAGIDAVLPGQFWAHYFLLLLLLPPSALLAGYLAGSLHDAWPRRAKQALAVALLVLIYPVGIYRDVVKTRALAQNDTPNVIAGEIAPRLSPGDAIFVLNYQPVLYLLSGARLPTRHVLPADWSWRYRQSTGVRPLVELDAIFRQRPKFVVFVDRDWQQMGPAVFAALRRHLAAAYTRDFEAVDREILPEPVAVQVWRLKSAPSPAS